MLSINGRFLTQRITGVQRYAHEMLHALDGLLEAHAGKNALEAELLVPPEVLEEPTTDRARCFIRATFSYPMPRMLVAASTLSILGILIPCSAEKLICR